MWTAILGSVLPLLPGLIKGVEGIFKKRDQSEKLGDIRADALREMLKVLCSYLKKAGFLNEIPSDDVLRGVIEAIFQNLKITGELAAPIQAAIPLLPAPGAAPVLETALNDQGVYVVRGSIVRV